MKYNVKVSYIIEKEVEALTEDEATDYVVEEFFGELKTEAELLNCEAEELGTLK